ncbi:hypothetical protein [Vibrio diazotrophicus]|uniref:hypothetical protein n=1 Tax=Vibrio diazotrophicus TaxID=685 RepID=UPI000C9E71DD|nr:hypothetical protein [Vibrio diazotrophicus]PNH95348.1 hypothetical protein C1O24_15620 [Vibrio diazotrophicus]
MSFVVDSSEWNFDGLQLEQVEEKLERFLERIDDASSRNETVYVDGDLQTRDVIESEDLWQYLTGVQSQGLDPSIIQELSAFLNKVTFFDDDESTWPPFFLVENVNDVNGESVELPLQFVHLHCCNRTPFALLSINEDKSISTFSSIGQFDIIYVNTSQGHVKFWRENALSIIRDTEANLQLLSSHAFPNLYFYEDVWSGISSFDGGYAAVRHDLKRHLSVLNDYGAWIFTTSPPALSPEDTCELILNAEPTNELIQRRFQGKGLDVSPEKPNVKAHNTCRKAREISINGNTFYCEWHTKLELHKNRIHVYKPVQDADNKLIVGIFHEHLPLP